MIHLYTLEELLENPSFCETCGDAEELADFTRVVRYQNQIHLVQDETDNKIACGQTEEISEDGDFVGYLDVGNAREQVEESGEIIIRRAELIDIVEIAKFFDELYRGNKLVNIFSL